jgi:sugar phosphate isomerase/epimerase
VRLSVITDEISPDLGVALRECEAMGISAVELRSVGGRNLVHRAKEEAFRVRAALGAGGFSCPVVDTPFLKTPLDEVAWPDLERGFEIAHLVGARTVRVFSGLRAAGRPRAGVVDLLAAALARAQEAGLRLAMEIEHTCTIATGAAARALLADPALEGLGLVWDPGNEAHFLGSTPDPGPVRDLRAAIFHVHVKDADPGAWVRLGTGVVDWPAQLSALADIGYQGYLSMETHYQLPSGGGAAATRESVESLRKLASAAGIELA